MTTSRLGRLLATRGALNALTPDELLTLVARHASGDFGTLCPEDRAANERALLEGSRILSAYDVDGERIWIITAADRSSTCILLPAEY
jgi:hypothetical protein